MKDSQMTDRPQLTWVAVTDKQGRVRMEARWFTAESLGLHALRTTAA